MLKQQITKKIFTLSTLLCTMGVFVANAAGTYTGRLTISIDGDTPTVEDGQNVVVIEGDIVTLTIPDSSYPGYPKADIVIMASKDVTGNSILKAIKYGFLRLPVKLDDGPKVSDSSRNTFLAISAVLQKAEVTFTGIK